MNKITLPGKIAGIYLGQDPLSFITTRVEQAQVTFTGFVGDKHSGATLLSGGRTPHYPRGLSPSLSLRAFSPVISFAMSYRSDLGVRP